MTRTKAEKRKALKKQIREKKNRKWKNLGKGGSPTRRQWKDEPLHY